jgi:phage portal protein BeeE
MATEKRKPGRPRKSKAGRPSKSSISKRLYPTEQVRDDVEQSSVGFGAGLKSYEPLKKLGVTQIRDLILTCGWIEDCINTITEEAVKYPLTTKPEDKNINAFLKYPSEVDPMFIIRKKILKDMARYGNGACVIAYKQGKPYALRPIPGYAIRITDDNPPKYKIKDINGGGYKKDKNDKEILLSNKEVMHFQIDADSDSTMARSPLERVYDLVVSDKNVTKALSEFTSRGFFRPSFVTVQGGTKKDIDEFVEFLNQMVIEGSKIFGLNKDAKVTEMPHWTATEIIDIQKWIGLRVANAFKVPPFMLNLVADVGSLNAREQHSRFLENVVLPILKYECYIYTMKLARSGFEKPKVEIVAPSLQLAVNYNKIRSAAMTISKDESLLTVDEARELFLGLDPKKTGGK